MPTISDYLRLAPFSVDELVEAANSVLRERPRLHVARRTVRYYVGEKVMPPPDGPPKHARYEADHLIRLVAARCLGDEGRSLEAIRGELARKVPSPEGLQALIDGPVEIVENLLREPVGAFDEGLVRRTVFGRIVVESPAEMSHEEIVAELSRAMDAFR